MAEENGSASLDSIIEGAAAEVGIDIDSDIEYGEEGVVFVPKAKPATPAATPEVKPEVKPVTPATPVAKVDTPVVSPDSFEGRYLALQSHNTKKEQENALLLQSVSDLLKVVESGKPNQTPVEPESEADLETITNDKEALSKFVGKIVKDAIAEAVGDTSKIKNLVQTNDVGLELQAVISNPTFKDYADYSAEIKTVFEMFPDQPFEKIFKAAKTLHEGKPAPGVAADTGKPTVTPSAVTDLVAKAKALETESGVNGTIPAKTPGKKKISDAVRESLAELGL